MTFARFTQLLAVPVLSLVAIPAVSSAAIIAGFDFQTTTAGGTAAAASPSAPKVYLSNAGAQAGVAGLYLDGTHGSSTWFEPATGSTATELNAFAGSALNAQTGMSTVTTGLASLALVDQTANGKAAVFEFDMTGYTTLDVSYATQRTTTGFNSQAWSYSTDGTTWTPVTTFTTEIPASFGVLSLPTITGLSGASTAYLQLVVTGATAAAGNNRLDNVVFSVPEPASMSLISVGLLAVARRRRA